MTSLRVDPYPPGRVIPKGEWFAAYIYDLLCRPSKTKAEGEARQAMTFMAKEVDELWVECERLRAENDRLRTLLAERERA